MRDEDIGNDLQHNGLQRRMTFGEAMEEEGQVLFREILHTVSMLSSFLYSLLLNSPSPANNTAPDTAGPFHESVPLDSVQLEQQDCSAS